MNTANALLFIHAQTSLHPGTGTALGTVDLPIQRERHTGWPTIAGSSLKGILRDACREQAKANHAAEIGDDGKERRSQRRVANEDDQQLVAVFGPGKVDESSAHAGALSVTDARILAFPVRSLNGVFVWVTCPTVLDRLHRDLLLGDVTHNHAPPATPSPPSPDEAIVLAENADPVSVDSPHGRRLVLEEFDYASKPALPTEWSWAKWLADRVCVSTDPFTRNALLSRLVVLHDDNFTHCVQHATEVVARIGLNYETKTVKSGALFYQEFLPAETLLYAVVLACESRKKDQQMKAEQVLSYIATRLPSLLQVGGDETIGKGLCRVRLANGKAGA
jgi:CRISPR-associated protein Cmr4